MRQLQAEELVCVSGGDDFSTLPPSPGQLDQINPDPQKACVYLGDLGKVLGYVPGLDAVSKTILDHAGALCDSASNTVKSGISTTNQQVACETNGNTWDNKTGTCVK